MPRKLSRLGTFLALLTMLFASPLAALAEDGEGTSEDKSAQEKQAASAESAQSATANSVGIVIPSSSAAKEYPPFDKVLEGKKTTSGMLTLHQKDNKLFAELKSSDLNKDYIVLITIARGIGQMPVLGGMSWGFGDDWVWQFRKVGERIHIVRRNLRFKAKAGSPEAKAVELAYTDSVLFSLPIVTKGPSGGFVVDLTPVFFSDLPQISQELPGFSVSPTKSTWAEVKGFSENMEIEVAATYASSGRATLDTVADSRGATINVHYSISKLPPKNRSGYTPRLADDRVGYFLTVLKDFSKNDPKGRFIRYINRWNLQKADPQADKSPPKQQILFYLEKTIPYKYRKPIRDGILEWNKAFEEVGFVDAIEVRQQDENDNFEGEFDPANINYNFFRWITSGAGFAMGPSRVDPRTGQILDADIIFDADWLQYWKREYETFTPKGIEMFLGGPFELVAYREWEQKQLFARAHQHGSHCMCNLLAGKSHDLAMAHSIMATRTQNKKDLEKLIMQALKDVTMHEVGHTLGLRHNFKASTYYSIDEANKVENTSKTGLTASVMDYTPANLMPQGRKQGDYYSTTIGPYDMWAIEYGYKPLSGSTESEKSKLEEIAARSTEPGHAYATEIDTRSIDPDPLANRYDFGDDPLAFAKLQAKLVAETWPDIVDRLTEEGDDYVTARRAFGVLISTHGRSMYFAARNIGGLYTTRSHKGDKDADPPFKVVPTAEQRKSLELLEEQLFSETPFQFPPELYSKLGSSRWSHWGAGYVGRSDFAAHDTILMWQDMVLSKLLSNLTLSRVHDNQIKVGEDEEPFTVAELLERLTKAIYSEVANLEDREYSAQAPAVHSLRRNLQRAYLDRLANLALGRYYAPEDAQTLAYIELKDLGTNIKEALEENSELDRASAAHLQETSDRIEKVLDARISQLP